MPWRQNTLIFGIFKTCKSKIAYTGPENTKNENFLRQAIKKSTGKLFQGLRMYHIVQNLDETDQGYQSHQLLTESDV